MQTGWRKAIGCPNGAAGSGYCKATGADKPIGKPKPLGIKKALVFYSGKAPEGEKTNWIMHEYRLAVVDRSAHKKNGLRLDDWVLCRLYNKEGNIEKSPQGLVKKTKPVEMKERKPSTLKSEALLPPPALAPVPSVPANDCFHFDSSDSIPKLHTDLRCSEQVVSPEFASEVQREPKWNEWNGNDPGHQMSPLQHS